MGTRFTSTYTDYTHYDLPTVWRIGHPSIQQNFITYAHFHLYRITSVFVQLWPNKTFYIFHASHNRPALHSTILSAQFLARLQLFSQRTVTPLNLLLSIHYYIETNGETVVHFSRKLLSVLLPNNRQNLIFYADQINTILTLYQYDTYIIAYYITL